MNKKKVDIIIPNVSYEKSKKIINKFDTYDDLSLNSINIILNEGEKILEDISSYGKLNINFIEKNHNINILEAINDVILNTNEDIILLNEDIVITKLCIHNLIESVYSDKLIATANPISNRSRYSHKVDFLKNREKNVKFNTDQIEHLVNFCSLRKFPKIPIIEFSCVYIKRESIIVAGIFDASKFKSIQGALVDFCYRTEKYGYRNILSDNAFVFQTKILHEKNFDKDEVLIEKLYNKQKHNIQEFISNDLNKAIFENIKVYIDGYNRKKNILYVVQADFRDDSRNNIGGTQFHVKDLTINLKHDYNIFVLARDGAYIRVTRYIDDEVASLKFYVGEVSNFPTYFDKNIEKIVDETIKAFKIDIIHVHHTLGLSLDVYYKAKEHNIPVIATLHDFYTLCPRITLLDSKKQVCHAVCDIESGNECLKESFDIAQGFNFISNWRKVHTEALELCDKIIVPSKSTNDYFLKYMPRLKGKINVIGHGVDEKIFNKYDSYEKYAQDTKRDKLNVAIIGGISEVKGSKIIFNSIKKSSNNINWFIFGGIGDPDLFLLKKKNLSKCSWYKREQLKELFMYNKIDIVCILSIVPETFCYTLSESLACGIPVVATNIGALGDRAIEYGCNYVVEYDSTADELLEILENIRLNTGEYINKLDVLEKIKVKDINEMTQEYKSLYESFDLEIKKKYVFDSKFIYDAFVLGEYILENNSEVIVDEKILERLIELENKLQKIESSLGYKILRRIQALPEPLKSILKGLTYKSARIYNKFFKFK